MLVVDVVDVNVILIQISENRDEVMQRGVPWLGAFAVERLADALHKGFAASHVIS